MFGNADTDNRKREGKIRGRGVLLVSNIRKDGEPVGVLPDGDMQFHSDGSHRDISYRCDHLVRD